MLRLERWVLFSGLVIVILLAWAYLVYLTFMMQRSSAGMEPGMQMTMPVLIPWSLNDILLNFLMWVVMMVGMMVPSSAPMISVYYKLVRQRAPSRTVLLSTCLFVTGYLATWSLFALVATQAQWLMHDRGLLNMKIATESSLLGGLILIAAGVYQFTPLKNVCLSACRSPLGFLITEWRDKPGGAFLMGVRHGTYCLGCCWLLMALLFVGGVMNLLWVAGIAVYILAEKISPAGQWVSRIVGAGILLWGIMILGSFSMF